MRAGGYIEQSGGFRAFIPAPLPPDPPIRIEPDLSILLSDADRELGNLNGASSILQDADLLASMFVRHEAVMSCQIDGNESSLDEVLQFEINPKGRHRSREARTVFNYTQAMHYGFRCLEKEGLNLSLICRTHGELMKGVKARGRRGEFRNTQTWIGRDKSTPHRAAYVPPPPEEMGGPLHNLERFLSQTGQFPVLIRCALAHAQFEAIHPFAEGNGRIGRLLITFFLSERGLLHQPLLYLSQYFREHQGEYFDRLMAIRTRGDWEGWLRFFLQGVYVVSRKAFGKIFDMRRLHGEHRRLMGEKLGRGPKGPQLLGYLFQQPIVTVRIVERHLGCAFETANKLVDRFVELRLLQEITGDERNRRFRYKPYLALFKPPPPGTAVLESC